MRFLKLFLLFGAIFAPLDPDPGSGYESGYGSTDLIESGANPDPDTKHCNQDSLKRNLYLKSAADLAILDVGALLQILEAQLVCFVKLQQAQGCSKGLGLNKINILFILINK
jgi:hypothetical protein